MFNPLNTARRTAHSFTAIKLDGIQGYDSYKDGIDATVVTLQNGLYAPILAALHQGTEPQAVLDAARASRWSTSHYAWANWAGIRTNARHQIATASCG